MLAADFSHLILTWFDQHGRKDLPWQQNKTPYRVWISEIMLQQTQVKTVIPYFQRFMERFPKVDALAQAPVDDVLHYWTGLGYYSRARNLHLAAKTIMAEYQGIFPSTLEDLQTLPGIGRSTAGAISAIAYQQPTPILDGNVKRVLARYHGVQTVISNKATENQLWAYASQYVPNQRAADYTQAMMDLGATCCTRSKPRCDACPLQAQCVAHQQHLTHLIPKKKTSKALPTKQATFLILQWQHQVLLIKRPDLGIWGGLWCFPDLPGVADEAEIHRYCLKHLHTSHYQLQPLVAFRHTFSHYHLEIFPIQIALAKQPRKISEKTDSMWYDLQQPATIGFPKPVVQLVRGLTFND